MKRIKKRLNTILAIIVCVATTSFPGLAAPITSIEFHENSNSSRVLLTLNDRIWSFDGMIEFDVTYVVDDANERIVEVKNVYVSAKDEWVKSYYDASVYLSSQGDYAEIRCTYYTLDGKQEEAIATIEP